MLSRLVPQRLSSGTTKPTEASEEQRETWQRVTLASGVELHFREPSAPDLHEHIAELIQIARELFPDEKSS
jgi:hypothetical protein